MRIAATILAIAALLWRSVPDGFSGRFSSGGLGWDAVAAAVFVITTGLMAAGWLEKRATYHSPTDQQELARARLWWWAGSLATAVWILSGWFTAGSLLSGLPDAGRAALGGAVAALLAGAGVAAGWPHYRAWQARHLTPQRPGVPSPVAESGLLTVPAPAQAIPWQVRLTRAGAGIAAALWLTLAFIGPPAFPTTMPPWAWFLAGSAGAALSLVAGRGLSRRLTSGRGEAVELALAPAAAVVEATAAVAAAVAGAASDPDLVPVPGSAETPPGPDDGRA